jgi:hypothetical protein
MAYNEDDCTYDTTWSRLSIEAVLSELDPDRLTRAGCRVIKHPDCCVLCATNNDCRLLPRHFNCRCRPEGYLEIEIVR